MTSIARRKWWWGEPQRDIAAVLITFVQRAFYHKKGYELRKIFRLAHTDGHQSSSVVWIRKLNQFCFKLYFFLYISTPEPLRAYQTGMDKGLIVVLNTSTDDYFYSLRSTLGYQVGIHNPYNFPDATNGNYHQFIIPQNTEAFLKLDVATIKTDKDVMRYSLQKVCINIFTLWEYLNSS